MLIMKAGSGATPTMIMVLQDIRKGVDLGGSTVYRGMPWGSGLGRPTGSGAAAKVSVERKHCLEIGNLISGLCYWHSIWPLFVLKSAKNLMTGIKGSHHVPHHKATIEIAAQVFAAIILNLKMP